MSQNFAGMYDGTQSLSSLQTASPVIFIASSAQAAITAMTSLDITGDLDYDALAKLCDTIAAGVKLA